MTNEEAIEWLGCLERTDKEQDVALRMAIEALQERKTGKWIVLDECSNSGYFCSNCHKKLVKEGWSNTVKKIKFCPNCGAEMEGADNDTRNQNS